MNEEQNKSKIDWYMNVYQVVADSVLTTIPEDDTSLDDRTREQLKLANEHMLKMLDALSNIVVLTAEPDVDEKELW